MWYVHNRAEKWWNGKRVYSRREAITLCGQNPYLTYTFIDD